MLGSVYPEIIDKKAHIVNVIKAEERSFYKTLDRGLNHFDKVVRNLSDKTIPGSEAFKLYDTYGFPIDLTQLMAREQNLEVDEKGFLAAMQEQKKRAKSSGKFKVGTEKINWNIAQKSNDSHFVGYDLLDIESRITRWSKIDNRFAIVLDKTPFYAESGGQIGDTGTLLGDGIDLNVIDTKKDNDRFIHYCEGDFDGININNLVRCNVDVERRDAIQRNHTATHLLHSALKEVLGEHVHQAGSSVGPDNFRFDLTHFEKITSQELTQVETLVNNEIIKNTNVIPSIKSFDDAKKEGAEALFGEKYGDEVRVLTIGNFSKELCGGTHVNRTGDIGLFKIIEESSLAAGVRRIIAITGEEAVKYVQKQNDIIIRLQDVLRSSQDELVERAEQIIFQRKELEKAAKKHTKGIVININDEVHLRDSINSLPINENVLISDNKKAKVFIDILKLVSVEELKLAGDSLLSKMKSGVGVLGMKGEKKPSVVIVVTQDLIKKGIKAGDIAKEIGALMGGGGGGKPHLATAGGQDNSKLAGALKKAPDIIRQKLEGIV